MSGSEREIAHLVLAPAEIAAVTAGDDAFLEYLAKHRHRLHQLVVQLRARVLIPRNRNSCGSRPCQVEKLRSERPRACGE